MVMGEYPCVLRIVVGDISMGPSFPKKLKMDSAERDALIKAKSSHDWINQEVSFKVLHGSTRG